MDNAWRQELVSEAEKLGVTVSAEVAERLSRLADELLRWNGKVNLTAITAPTEVLEKHFLDSLALVPLLAGSRRLLDIGAGAGFPGLPVRIVLPTLEVELVEAVGKKVGFSKQMIASLGLFPGARATQGRAEGDPDREKIARGDAVVSRALMDVGPWLALARKYVLPGGRVFAMLAQGNDAVLAGEAERHGMTLTEIRRFRLPSGDPRAIAVFRAAT